MLLLFYRSIAIADYRYKLSPSWIQEPENLKQFKQGLVKLLLAPEPNPPLRDI